MSDGGPAFPGLDMNSSGDLGLRFTGMSLRDWFAGQALKGMLTDPNVMIGPSTAILSYQMADAMLEARNK